MPFILSENLSISGSHSLKTRLLREGTTLSPREDKSQVFCILVPPHSILVQQSFRPLESPLILEDVISFPIASPLIPYRVILLSFPIHGTQCHIAKIPQSTSFPCLFLVPAPPPPLLLQDLTTYSSSYFIKIWHCYPLVQNPTHSLHGIT